MSCLRPVALLFVLLCSACSSSDPSPIEARSVFYQPVGGVCRNDMGRFASWNYFVNPSTCKGCNVVDEPAGLDGDEFSAASILMGTTADGFISIFARAPEGVVFPGGTRPAVIAFHERTAPGVFFQGDVRTYLNGVLQDQSGIDFGNEQIIGNELDGQYAFNIAAYGGANTVQATQPFDTLELFVRFGPGFTEHIQVYEFCVDTNPPPS